MIATVRVKYPESDFNTKYAGTESHKRRQRNTETRGKTQRCNDVIFFQIDVYI